MEKIETQKNFNGKGVFLLAPFLLSSLPAFPLSFEMSTIPFLMSSIDEQIAQFTSEIAHFASQIERITASRNELVRYKAEIAARLAAPVVQESPVLQESSVALPMTIVAQPAPQAAPQAVPQAAPQTAGPYILPDEPIPLLSCHEAPRYDVILARNLAQGELIYRRKRSGEVNVARVYRFQEPTQPGVSHMEFHFQLSESEPRQAFKSLSAFSGHCLELDRRARGAVLHSHPAEDGKHCYVIRDNVPIRLKSFYA